jgi:hypothetical protein
VLVEEGTLVAVMVVCGRGRGGYVLPLSAFVFELARVAAHVCCHAPSARVSASYRPIHFVRYILHTQISSTEDIHPLEPKTRKHLYTPPSQSPHSYQFLNQLVVARTNQHLRAELAIRELLREAGDVFCLALGQACGA